MGNYCLCLVIFASVLLSLLGCEANRKRVSDRESTNGLYLRNPEDRIGARQGAKDARLSPRFGRAGTWSEARDNDKAGYLAAKKKEKAFAKSSPIHHVRPVAKFISSRNNQRTKVVSNKKRPKKPSSSASNSVEKVSPARCANGACGWFRTNRNDPKSHSEGDHSSHDHSHDEFDSDDEDTSSTSNDFSDEY